MPLLDGVLTPVKALLKWAVDQGYELVRIDDEIERVTVERIKDELTPIKGHDRESKPLLDRPRIVIYFAATGCMRCKISIGFFHEARTHRMDRGRVLRHVDHVRSQAGRICERRLPEPESRAGTSEFCDDAYEGQEGLV